MPGVQDAQVTGAAGDTAAVAVSLSGDPIGAPHGRPWGTCVS